MISVRMAFPTYSQRNGFSSTEVDLVLLEAAASHVF